MPSVPHSSVFNVLAGGIELNSEEEEQRVAFLHRQASQRTQQAMRRSQAMQRNREMSGHTSDSEDEAAGRVAISDHPTIINGRALLMTPDSSMTPSVDADGKLNVPEKLDPELVGMSVGLKHMYGGKEDRRGRFQWQTTIPEDVGKPVEDAETQKWALIVRYIKAYSDPSKTLTLHSIVVQSPLLKDLLKTVLAGYPGVTVDLQRLELSGKFEPIIHRWSELTAAIDELKKEQESKTDEESDGAVRLKHATLFDDTLVSEFQDAIDSSIDMKAKGVMTYEYLWTLFIPGQLVFSRQEGQERVLKLYSGRYGMDRDGNDVFALKMQYIDWDGSRWGTQKLSMMIRSYPGTRPITSLSVSPLDFHSNKDEIKARLVERGSKIEDLAGTHYKAYEGMGWRYNTCGQKDKYSIKGRIVIDTYGWNRFNPNWSVHVTALNSKLPEAETNPPQPGSTSYIPPVIQDQFDPMDEYEQDDDADIDMPVDGHFADEDEERHGQALADDQKLLCTHLLRGYALKEKLWLNLYVNSVKEIQFHTRAFDSLVLPENQKELILGFTASQRAHRNAFDDVIEGKGRGVVILLSGAPGVGKTLTAESVAEEMNVPLFVMSAGDVGLDSRHIEARLQNVFEMVARWNAILLLDEADVFLEERSLHELERNKLVSIFLRVLEYYEGIMFLTTNRVSTFDAAFQSRIHISLDYPELNADSRLRVWQNFLGQHDAVQLAVRERGVASKNPAAELAKAKSAATNGEASGAAEDGKANGGDSSLNATEDDAADAAEQTRKETHILSTRPHAITAAQQTSLAGMPMNGRQIKNVLKTAQLLASHRLEALGKEHIDKVLDVTQHLHNASREKERTRSAIFS